ncbi:hypothetical protein PhaeoP83_00196 [Phaeobacter inhibens]|uniref:Uncharacterized protein n=1 Tax=Phaeobacter inhibens TaxID=221822 RepID=A0A2I7KD33_9RHOB|nr:hypothetical protein PhaeoP83_00196 [Phaeobacter inhibens]AUQ93017.1 hypothetical protein PhaeoP66_00189 [Phaeobacter inhibens]AUR00509.1 hypothetical protein PhaeoP88_03178 [Phaeobacter inhibens]AUR18320.1 hypothetical protein PhaeoP80_00196 [Phaeobacter inhibens]
MPTLGQALTFAVFTNEKGPRFRRGLLKSQTNRSQSPVDTSMVLPSSRVT